MIPAVTAFTAELPVNSAVKNLASTASVHATIVESGYIGVPTSALVSTVGAMVFAMKAIAYVKMVIVELSVYCLQAVQLYARIVRTRRKHATGNLAGSQALVLSNSACPTPKRSANPCAVRMQNLLIRLSLDAVSVQLAVGGPCATI